jgi:predicted lipoprotein with Yx(FWY)xxD motif
MRIASHTRAIVLVCCAALIGAAAATAASHAVRAAVGVRTTPLGKVLVDRNGHTLYLFEKDKRGMSSCAGSCASFWPPLMANGKPAAAVGSGVKGSLLATTKRRDGRRQITYRGHPLYRFSLDTRAGQTKGEGLDDFGAHWYAVSPAGTKVVKQMSNGGGSGSGGGGYPYGP